MPAIFQSRGIFSLEQIWSSVHYMAIVWSRRKPNLISPKGKLRKPAVFHKGSCLQKRWSSWIYWVGLKWGLWAGIFPFPHPTASMLRKHWGTFLMQWYVCFPSSPGRAFPELGETQDRFPLYWFPRLLVSTECKEKAPTLTHTVRHCKTKN